MPFIQEGEFLPAGVPRAIHGRAGEAVQGSPDEVPQRVAGERVEGEQNDVGQQNQSPQSDAEVVMLVRPEKKEGLDRVIPEEAKEDYGPIQEVAVEVLQDEGEA